MSGNFRPPSRRGSADAGPSLPNTSILRVLTNTQNASAAVFGVFFTAHIAAPIAAAFGGLEAADNVMVGYFQLHVPGLELTIRSLDESSTSRSRLG